jgi:hypothetical protein
VSVGESMVGWSVYLCQCEWVCVCFGGWVDGWLAEFVCVLMHSVRG